MLREREHGERALAARLIARISSQLNGYPSIANQDRCANALAAVLSELRVLVDPQPDSTEQRRVA